MKLIITVILVFAFTAASAQRVGGSCEGCEAVFEYHSKKLTSVDTLPDFKETRPKLEISGTIYQADRKTPAKDVILYIYHTDQKGVYPLKGNETGWAKRHGYLRGWIKTNADGKYRFYTLRPASYPNSRAPQLSISSLKLLVDFKKYHLRNGDGMS